MIYCESYPDAEIVKDLEGTKSVILVGCPGCANSSLYLRNAPAGSAMMTLSPAGFNAVPMQNEIDRLKRLLSGKGLKVGSLLGKYPTGVLCIPDKRCRDKIIKNCREYDTIITFSCDGGIKSVSKIMKGKKIIRGMKAVGIMSAFMRTDRLFTKLSIDKDSVEIVKFMIDK
jgi:hypothetical protein